MGAERCPICDRPDCQRYVRKAEGRRVTARMYSDCRAHAVDWKAEALRLRAKLSEYETLVIPSWKREEAGWEEAETRLTAERDAAVRERDAERASAEAWRERYTEQCRLYHDAVAERNALANELKRAKADTFDDGYRSAGSEEANPA